MKISLFKSINPQLKKSAGIRFSVPVLQYKDPFENEKKTTKVNKEIKDIVVNEIFPEWSPTEHNLLLAQKFAIKSPDKLFGMTGVTHANNTLGLACHIYSKTSNFQETIFIDEIKYQKEEFKTLFKYNFPSKCLYGTIFFEYYIYLKDYQDSIPFGSNVVGINLCDEFIDSYSFIIDGQGSEFPIEEINDPDKPLWMVKLNWIDIFEDLFDSNSVRLILNQAHPLFNQLIAGKTRVSQYLMNEAIVNAIILVLQQALIVEKNNIDENTTIPPGSIAQVIKYWIEVFNVETESIESIANTVRTNAMNFKGDNNV
ncbi:hypothetical protein ACWOA0_07925 [Ignavigranum ruoffiae]